MVRWYQVGAFSPFFRAHGHIGELVLTLSLSALSRRELILPSAESSLFLPLPRLVTVPLGLSDRYETSRAVPLRSTLPGLHAGFDPSALHAAPCALHRFLRGKRQRHANSQVILQRWASGAELIGQVDCRPQYVVFPSDPNGFAIDNQFYFGSSGLLVKPVVEEGATSAEVYIADDQVRLRAD